MAKRIILKGLIGLLLVVSVASHSWMTNPTPASGGGTGAGNASTQGPCGKVPPASITTVTATFKQTTTGVVIDAGFMKANPHGTPYNAKFNLCAQSPSSCTANAKFNYSLYDQPFSDPSGSTSTTLTRTASLTIPPEIKGKVLIQYIGNLGGGLWYDCAYVNILDTNGNDVSGGTGGTGGTTTPNACATSNPCSPNANCATNNANQASCTCKAGYYGTGFTCNLITSTMKLNVAMTLRGTTVNSTNAGSVQNIFTAGLSLLLSFPVSRIAYDQAVMNGADAIVYFTLTPDPITGSVASDTLNQLKSLIAAGDPAVATSVGYPVKDVSSGSSVVTFGEGAQQDSSSSNAWIGAAVGVPIGVVAIAAIGVFLYKRKQNKSYSGSSYRSQAEGSYNSAVPASSPSYSVPVAAAASTTPGNTTSTSYYTWTTHRDQAGHIYYFNHETGESKWEKPQGQSVAPLDA